MHNSSELLLSGNVEQDPSGHTTPNKLDEIHTDFASCQVWNQAC